MPLTNQETFLTFVFLVLKILLLAVVGKKLIGTGRVWARILGWLFVAKAALDVFAAVVVVYRLANRLAF